jgi:hypothetical protein
MYFRKIKILSITEIKKKKKTIISKDAEKAFGKIQYQCLIKILSK